MANCDPHITELLDFFPTRQQESGGAFLEIRRLAGFSTRFPKTRLRLLKKDSEQGAR